MVRPLKTLVYVAIAGTIAYFSGCPPPQRFFGAQGRLFDELKTACEKNGSKGFVSRTMCAEKIYRNLKALDEADNEKSRPVNTTSETDCKNSCAENYDDGKARGLCEDLCERTRAVESPKSDPIKTSIQPHQRQKRH